MELFIALPHGIEQALSRMRDFINFHFISGHILIFMVETVRALSLQKHKDLINQ